MRKRIVLRATLPTLMALAALATLSCESSDPVAIEGSEIILTAQPSPVDLLLDPLGQSTIQARVTNASGVPQEDVIVFFSTTNGTVTPDSDITEALGRAFTTFANSTTTTATISARSGSIEEQLQLQVLQGTASQHTLGAFPDAIFSTCSDVITLRGTVVGNSGPLSGALATVSIISQSPAGVGSIPAGTDLTDTNGEYSVTLNINSAVCDPDCTTIACTIDVRATAAGAQSNVVTLNDGL